MYQQPQTLQRGTRHWVQEGGQQGPVNGAELDALVAELPLQHSELVPQDKDLGVLVVVAALQQPQQRERIGDTKVGQAKEHDASSSRGHRHRSEGDRRTDEPLR
jgi:hypothetical protein